MKILIIVIYLSFISLGLPDALLGSAWTTISTDFKTNISNMGIATMIISCCSVISSLYSDKIANRFKTGNIVMISVVLTSIALIGIYTSQSFMMICLYSIPLGFGSGAVDSILNNFVAIHYKSREMNFIHCFWGVGATLGPFIMSMCLLKSNWRMGYLIIAIIQIVIIAILYSCRNLFNRLDDKIQKIDEIENTNDTKIQKKQLLTLTLVSFFCYCAIEATTGAWASTYLVNKLNIKVEIAAKWVSIYYLGITLGRFICGFISDKLSNKKLIRFGQITIIIGSILFMINRHETIKPIGLILIGLGCAPIFPALIHETPYRFSKETSQKIIGLQIAIAYVGTICIPPLFGIISKYTSTNILPYFILVLAMILFITCEGINKILKSEYKKI